MTNEQALRSKVLGSWYRAIKLPEDDKRRAPVLSALEDILVILIDGAE